ncbi:MAG: T9SS type A sorting domain-containing protein [Ignavibacteria bacterium]|nr:T9SS type A sorting domain-containing protein [Ignavibacteria bacterium]
MKTASHVKLRVYDIRGVMVNELVNGGWSAGRFISGFDGTNLSSGVYFYRIEITADNTSEKFYPDKAYGIDEINVLSFLFYEIDLTKNIN